MNYMESKNIIFMLAAKFNKRDFDRYGFNLLINKGYNVKAWDLSPWINFKYYKNYQPPDPIEYDNYNLIKTLEEFKESLANLNNNDIIIDIGKIILKKRLYKYIQDKKVKTVALELNQLAISANSELDYLKNAFSLIIKDTLKLDVLRKEIKEHKLLPLPFLTSNNNSINNYSKDNLP